MTPFVREWRQLVGPTNEADQEHPAPAAEVPEPAGRHQSNRERERVAGDFPLHRRGRDVQSPLDGRQDDIHDADVEQVGGEACRVGLPGMTPTKFAMLLMSSTARAPCRCARCYVCGPATYARQPSRVGA